MSLTFSSTELRTLARVGALAQATRIVTEFPDILTELNKIADNGHQTAAPPRRPSAKVRANLLTLARAAKLFPVGFQADGSPLQPPRRRRKQMSAAARKRIGAAVRRRWREKRKQAQA